MDSDPGILCVQHCGPRVFCFQYLFSQTDLQNGVIDVKLNTCLTGATDWDVTLGKRKSHITKKECSSQTCCQQIPEHCPVCRTGLAQHHPPLTPFRVPYPFVRAQQQPCAVIIKPTNGDFLNDYKMSMDLHIGVTDSRGQVVEYDQHGLRRGQRHSWQQCLVVSQICSEEWTDNWDNTLESVAAQDCWTPSRYHEETFNCYTFVMSFLRCLRDGTLSEAAASKVAFCEAFVSPRTTTACKYIALHRRLKDSGYYVCRSQPHS